MVDYTISLAPGATLEVVTAAQQANYVVESTTYMISATDGTNMVEWSSKVEFPPPSETFIPFTELTMQDVLAWVEVERAEQIEQMKAILAAELAEKVSPSKLTITPPWAEAQ